MITTSDRYIKITSCGDCDCRRKWYCPKLFKTGFSLDKCSVNKYVDNKTIHKDCPLPKLDAMIQPIVLHAALRWIKPEYRNHINNDGAYQIMMNDVFVGQSYKDDITLIRETIELNDQA